MWKLGGGIKCKEVIIRNPYGTNNKVLCNNTLMHNCTITFLGSDNKLIIGPGNSLYNVDFTFVGTGNTIIIGSNTYFDGNDEFCIGGGTTIKIGNGSMFAKNISVRTTDSHRIYDIEGNVLNKEKDIVIGEHVWIGMDSLILKGSTLCDGCVVAARSTVTASTTMKNNSVVAGTPAKMVKENVVWK